MTAEKGEFGKLGVDITAAVNMMALVSPAALARAKIEPVRRPRRAAGKTTRKIVWLFVAPNA